MMQNTVWSLRLWGLPARSFLMIGDTQTVRTHHIPSRPHVQGEGSALTLRSRAQSLSSATVAGGWMISSSLAPAAFAVSLAGERYQTPPHLAAFFGGAESSWSPFSIWRSGAWSVPAGRELVYPRR